MGSSSSHVSPSNKLSLIIDQLHHQPFIFGLFANVVLFPGFRFLQSFWGIFSRACSIGFFHMRCSFCKIPNAPHLNPEGQPSNTVSFLKFHRPSIVGAAAGVCPCPPFQRTWRADFKPGKKSRRQISILLPPGLKRPREDR